MFNGKHTRGLPLRTEYGQGGPLLRRFGVGVGGETLTGAAWTGIGDSGPDSGSAGR